MLTIEQVTNKPKSSTA